MNLFEIVLFLFMLYMSIGYFKLANEKNLDDDEHDNKEIKVFLEEIGGVYYAWHIEPKEKFIVQTKTVSDMVKELKTIFQNKTIKIKTTKEIECQLKELN